MADSTVPDVLRDRMKYVQWDLRTHISQGTFSAVYLGQRLAKSDGVGPQWPAGQVAVKLIPVGDDSVPCDGPLRIDIMSKINHPACLPLFAWDKRHAADGRDEYVLVTELQRSRLDQVLKTPPPDWNATKRSLCALGIAAGVCYLHSSLILHRDLKPANILLTTDLEPVICDFGLSAWLDPTNPTSNEDSVGTPLYMAPEVINGENYGTPIDVYSYGVLLYQLITGDMPFSHLAHGKIFDLQRHILQGERPQLPDDTPPGFKELVPRLWNADPNQRPTFAQIIEESDKLRFPGCDESAWNAYKAKVLGFLH
jgi:serine/threonine protein kinase